MIYRAAILGTFFIAAWTGSTIPASAQAWTIKGSCSKAAIAESDGVQTSATNGVSGKDSLALMQRARPLI